jgi:DNA-binding beta-propeller fold protein YncE
MKHARWVVTLSAAALLSSALVSYAQMEVRPIIDHKDIYYPPPFSKPQAAPEIPFEKVDPNWFKLPPSEKYGQSIDFGEVAAVTTDSKGHVFVLNRNDVRGNVYGGNATQVLEFDDKGNFVREIGHNIYGFAYGHSVRIDKDDNIWVVDKGSDTITKFDKITGKQMLVLGHRMEASVPYWLADPSKLKSNPEEGGFGAPTDIAWDSKGNMYVSDGYVHSRVAKFDPNGNWIGTWGKDGVGPGEFRTPHDIAVDKNDHVWVADRTNGRLQVFDTNGKYLREVIINVPTKKYQPLMGHQYPSTGSALSQDPAQNVAYRPGSPDALCIPPDNPNVMFVADLYPGRVYKIDLNGKVLGYFGHVGKEWGNPGSTHGLACPSENIIYTAEFINDRVERFVLHPENAKVTGN